MKKTIMITFLLIGLLLVGCQAQKKYMISFESNGGSSIAAIETDGKSTVSITASPEKEGYDFDGWFWDNDTFEDAFLSNALVNRPIDSDITVYAKWEPIDITISFDSNQGSVVAPITQKFATTIVAPAVPTKDGHHFVGWYTDSNLTIAYTFSTMPANSLTLFAKWDTATFALRCLDYDNTVIFDDMVSFDALIADYVLPTPTRTGYTFIGWGDSIPERMPSRLVLLYANYEVNQYEISFDSNGGSEVANLTADFATPITVPDDPIKEGYAFTGWYQDVALENAYAIPNTMPAETITLYAGWEIIEYTIYFEDNLTIITETNFASKEDFLNEFYTDFNQWFDDNVNNITALSKSGATFTLTLNGLTATWSNIAQMRDLDVYTVEKTLGNFVYKPFTRVGNLPVDPVEDNGYFLNTEPYRTKYQDCDRYFLNVILTTYTAYDKGYNTASGGRVQIFFRFQQWNKGTAIAAFNSLPTKFDEEKMYEGSISYPASMTYNILDDIQLASQTHSQMTFLGWFLHPLGAGEPLDFIPTGTTGNFKLYMIWDYDLTTHKVIYLDSDNTILKTELLNPGQTASPPVVVAKEGFVFKGWDKAMDNLTHDITVTAQYDAITYTITFDKNINEDVTVPNAITYTADDHIALPQLTLEGYIFVGWYDTIDGSGTAITHTTSGNKTLYARWVAIPDPNNPVESELTVVASEPIILEGRSGRVYAKNDDDSYLNPSSVLFFSAHPHIATVDDTGFVSGLTKGKATIIVVQGDDVATFEIEVVDEAFDIRWVGHQGSGGPFVQNTTEAFREGALRGYYALESDIRVSSDGVYFICHDDTFLPYLFVDESLHGTLMGGYTWNQLKDLQIKDTYNSVTYYATLTTVEEYLLVAKEYGVKVVLDLKWTNGINNNDQSRLPGLVELIKSVGMYEDAIFLSSMKNVLTFIRDNYSDANVQYLSGSTTTTAANVAWCIENKFDLNGPHNVITLAFINQMQAAGLYVNAYTVNTQSAADLLMTYGIDMITTDYLGVPTT